MKLSDNFCDSHKEFNSLINISQRIGKKIIYVQGGGGNTSLKSTDGMWIKASGCHLSNVSRDKGFVFVNHNMILSHIKKCKNEKDYSSCLERSIINGDERPSMEAGFHALLDRVVLHTHPIPVNILSCAVEGEAVAKLLFPEALWVPYVAPGISLSHKIQELLSYNTKPSIVLLQNHGLIINAETPQQAWNLHESCCQDILTYFKIKEEKLLRLNIVKAINDVLFPDQVVYLQNEKLRLTKIGQEIMQVYFSLLDWMTILGLNPRYLSIAETDELINMESEKYRQKIAGNFI